MTTLAHIVSGSLIGVAVAGVTPEETPLIFTAVASAGLVDIDHVFLLLKKRTYFKDNGYKNNLHKARSFVHELLGLLLVGLTTIVISFFNVRFALVAGIPAMIHLVEDFIMGISAPLNPINKLEFRLIPQNNKMKVAIDLVVMLTFGFLWRLYLRG